MAGKNIGFPQLLRPLSHLQSHRQTPFSGKEIPLQQAAVAGTFPKGHQRIALLIDQMDRKFRKGMEILQNRL